MAEKWQGEKKSVQEATETPTTPTQEVVVVESTENIITRRTSLLLSLISFGISLAFLSQNITGNVVANFSTNGANWLGGIFFLMAVVGALVYVQKSKDSKK